MKVESYKIIKKRLNDEGAFKISNKVGLITVLVEAVFIAAVLWGLTEVEAFSFGFFVLQLLLGWLMFRSSVLIHEFGHRTVFTNKRVNDFFGFAVSPLALIPYTSWVHIHQGHHRWTGFADKDPSSTQLRKIKSVSAVTLQMFNVVWRLWLPFPTIQFFFAVLWLNPLVEFMNKNYKLALKALFSVIVMLTPHVLVCMYVGVQTYFTFITIAALIHFFFYEAVTAPPHSGLYVHSMATRTKPLRVYEQDSVSRSSSMKPGWLSLYSMFNFNLHVEHHLYPSVPFYRLSKVRQRILQEDDSEYVDVPMLGFMAKLRKKHPARTFIDTLPPFKEEDAR
ncbi:hypothetical protein EAG18_03090 [Pseudoalteromonas sp. J010]|uniref:fatty acid desaturase family protein n=1 Tax=Pseudoalteromonas sp. J010 TaxID=998465 RepID=UPI000F64687D|nr:fatty acid desaturase [Pseudoalteromonas sp. J010]RRS10212.1 hypothetical protein EAG18_03090 [Pseudoalteromonas sp. J010]